MYLQHYGFTHHPFMRDLDAGQLYASAAAKDVAGRISHLVELRGIGLLTGESGSGKTTACRQAAEQLHPGQHQVCYASLTTGSVLDTLNVIAASMRLPPQRQRGLAWQVIREEVTRLNRERRLLPVLIVDEAHHLGNAVLEDLRLLTNFSYESDPRLCLLLVGLTQLRYRLSRTTHESLSQRIIMRHHLQPLSAAETQQYIEHRLRGAGAADQPYFEPQAIHALHDAASGIPRQINRLAHYALIAAAQQQAKQASAEHVEIACQEALR